MPKQHLPILFFLPLLTSCGPDASRLESFTRERRTETIAEDHKFEKQVNDWIAQRANLNQDQSILEGAATQPIRERPLISSTSRCLVESTKLLLSHGADPNVRGGELQATPLHFAINLRDGCSEEKSIELIDALTARGADVNAKDNFGQTPLHRAAMLPLDYPKIVQELISKGADVNARDSGMPGGLLGGETPLCKAIEVSHTDIVRLLLDHGADVNARNDAGRTPLVTAQDTKTANELLGLPGGVHGEIVKLLKEHGAQ